MRRTTSSNASRSPPVAWRMSWPAATTRPSWVPLTGSASAAACACINGNYPLSSLSVAPRKLSIPLAGPPIGLAPLPRAFAPCRQAMNFSIRYQPRPLRRSAGVLDTVYPASYTPSGIYGWVGCGGLLSTGAFDPRAPRRATDASVRNGIDHARAPPGRVHPPQFRHPLPHGGGARAQWLDPLLRTREGRPAPRADHLQAHGCRTRNSGTHAR